MASFRLLTTPVLMGLLAFPCCSSGTNDADKAPSPPTPKLVGRVSSIPPDRRFLLIESYGKWDIATGTTLTTRGTEGRTANLRVTGEAIGPFAAADIQAGDVLIGDAVYTLPKVKPPTPALTPAETSPDSQPAGENPEPEEAESNNA